MKYVYLFLVLCVTIVACKQQPSKWGRPGVTASSTSSSIPVTVKHKDYVEIVLEEIQNIELRNCRESASAIEAVNKDMERLKAHNEIMQKIDADAESIIEDNARFYARSKIKIIFNDSLSLRYITN